MMEFTSGALPVWAQNIWQVTRLYFTRNSHVRGKEPTQRHGTLHVKVGAMKSTFLTLSLFAALLFYTSLRTQGAGPDADNSANNKADQDSSAVTPEKQSNAEADVKVTRDIRRAIVKDDALSVYAHNLKIITTTNHVVYLRGAVSGSDDVSKIVSLAEKNSGGYPVKNQISVSSK